jgi:eukaryotic-like serine/threonine-protein kinase
VTPIEKALNAIVDGEPVPWGDVELPGHLAPGELESLRLLDDVARAFRQNDATDVLPRPTPLFRWGSLEVEERLGSGAFGEVWRAFDPWLRRTVALKLQSAADSPTRNGEQLEEARRLARIRHPNVLSCYGAAVHDGRAGLWSELIDGRSLRQVLADDGALSTEETLRIGRDVARALTAVHNAGLVHGDIKAENVMRERGGRIVLMDFGASGEERLLAARRLIAGTPAYLAPEVRDGASQSAQSDLYALGVLLFLLLTNRMPHDDAGAGASSACLAALRPDLDPRVAAVIQRCLDPDPSQRPRDAAELAASLSEASRADRAPRARNRVALIAACFVAATAALAFASARLFAPAWDADATFLRTRGGITVALAHDADVEAGDRLRLKLVGNRPMHVYVLNEDADERATVLYPLADGTSPLEARGETILPGGKRDTGLAWEVDGKSAREEFVVIAALAPVAALENDIAGWQRSSADRATRSAGSLVGGDGVVLQGAHLREVLAGLPQSDAVRTWRYAFPHARP